MRLKGIGYCSCRAKHNAQKAWPVCPCSTGVQSPYERQNWPQCPDILRVANRLFSRKSSEDLLKLPNRLNSYSYIIIMLYKPLVSKNVDPLLGIVVDRPCFSGARICSSHKDSVPCLGGTVVVVGQRASEKARRLWLISMHFEYISRLTTMSCTELSHDNSFLFAFEFVD